MPSNIVSDYGEEYLHDNMRQIMIGKNRGKACPPQSRLVKGEAGEAHGLCE
jgi:hypothetical protein